MIPLVGILEYTKNKGLDIAVTRFVNENLIAILDTFFDREDDETENHLALVPAGCYRDDRFSYSRKMQEIRNILADDLLRIGVISLSPLNQYIIYKLIVVYIEICGHTHMNTTIEVPQNLKTAINACDDYWSENDYWSEDGSKKTDACMRYNFVLQSISDYRNYLDFLFEDWDFLETCATTFVADYLKNPKSEFKEYGLEELNQFLPMVSDDIYDKFKETMEKNMEKRNTKTIISVNGNHAIINTGVAREIKSENLQSDMSSGKQEKKSFYEKYGIGAIIVALISLFGVILTIIFNA